MRSSLPSYAVHVFLYTLDNGEVLGVNLLLVPSRFLWSDRYMVIKKYTQFARRHTSFHYYAMQHPKSDHNAYHEKHITGDIY